MVEDFERGSTYQFFTTSRYPLFRAMGEFMAAHEEDVQARTIQEAAARFRAPSPSSSSST